MLSMNLNRNIKAFWRNVNLTDDDVFFFFFFFRDPTATGSNAEESTAVPPGSTAVEKKEAKETSTETYVYPPPHQHDTESLLERAGESAAEMVDHMKEEFRHLSQTLKETLHVVHKDASVKSLSLSLSLSLSTPEIVINQITIQLHLFNLQTNSHSINDQITIQINWKRFFDIQYC